MKKQTAMQTLIQWGDKMMLEHPMKILSFAEAIDKAVELLEMEREQMLKLISFVRVNNKMGKSADDLLQEFETYKGGEQ